MKDVATTLQMATVRTLFVDIALPGIEVFESPPQNYRMRCAVNSLILFGQAWNEQSSASQCPDAAGC